jgi:phage/plasmid-like protein (TIGR03299 family)
MSHNIANRNGKDCMMYTGEVPWHELGTKLNQPATSAEAIKAAGLDWDVRKVPLYAVEGNTILPAAGCMAVVPSDRWGQPACPIFGVVGQGYEILQNREAFAFFDAIVGKDAAIYHTAGALGQGENIWLLAKLPGLMTIMEGDSVEKYVLLSTGHDGRSAVRITITGVRVVCQNTLTQALSTGQTFLRAQHNRTLKQHLTETAEVLRAVNQAYTRMEKVCQAMLRRELDDAEVHAYLNAVIAHPAPTKGKMALPRWVRADRDGCFQQFKEGPGTQLPGVEGTLWAAYNGVTDYYDHFRRYGLRGDGNRMAGALFGRGLEMKNRAYHEACNLVRRRQ